MVSLKERTKYPRVISLNGNLPMGVNWSNRINGIPDALTQWKNRMEFWKHEFLAFHKIVELRFNEKKKFDELLELKFEPMQESMENEFSLLSEDLENFELRMYNAQMGKVSLERCLQQWSKLEKRLADFERDHSWNKRHFLNLLSRSMPVKIY